MTLYALLDVSEDASETEIKRAYRDAAKAHHPDVNPGAEPGFFARISEAHETLSDGARRAAYDAALRAERAATRGSSGAAAGSQSRHGSSGFETYANDFHGRASGEATRGGGHSESDLRRRERAARAKAEDAAAAAAWWRREKASSAAARVRFRRHAARAEGSRADRAGEALRNAGWVARRGATRADAVVAAACFGFVALAGFACFGREARSKPRNASQATVGTRG